MYYNYSEQIVRYDEKEKKIISISKQNEDLDIIEVYILKDPFPNLSIQDLLDGIDCMIIPEKSEPLQPISEEEYNRYKTKAIRGVTY